jgi:hypothetical protein
MMTATPARQMAAPMMQAGDEAIDAQRDDARADPGDALVFTDALPDEPGPADLEKGGDR